ncbi:hypothetical protein LZ012_12630 [Dechloromonas sp. XY25]|uniref:Circularly permuted type 2 ATP-grasp protein n=1 Tax=Dechloromonas hankyongensis TaxID=2908002 RepID=A0ABS9K3X0_9RHOO|nr:hypothetical protein [Dechloromonas hankyongensis]MCG2577836.1 hypothetical protein [Dechloromonas hankyongensis]
MKTTFDQLRERQPQLFSAAAITIDSAAMQAMADLIAAIESVIALPAFQAHALAQAPEIARLPVAARSVFMGYDFHLTDSGPKLIEINTNAGGGLLNAYLLAAHGKAAEGARIRDEFVAMFREEWRLARGDAPLRRIAIVDDMPAEQFLAPEFILFKELFEQHGIAAVVCDPSELARDGDGLCHAGQPVDLIYNRLTDFALDATENAAIRTVFEQGGVVLTPHPRAHALYADKRNLMQLSDDAALQALGVDETTRNILLAGIPQTVAVTPEQGEAFWAERKRWFFKPPAGFGSRAAYRGDKLTKRVFEEILHGGYIAQEIALPSEHAVPLGDGETTMKADIRCYVYNGHIQLVAGRLYQGQTTNFRTPGGGFAPVFIA